MADTPSWLTSGGNNNAGTVGGGGDNFEMTTGVNASKTATTTPSGATASGTAGAGAAETTTTPQEDLPKIILTMRLANMGVAIALMVCSVRRISCPVLVATVVV